MNMFSNNVWFRTEYESDVIDEGLGRSLWASRAVTREDTRKREDLLTWLDRDLSKESRDAARDRLHPW